MTAETLLHLALWLAGAGHFVILVASFQVPFRLGWKEDLAKLTPFNRKLMWTYGGFTVLMIVAFGTLLLALYDELSAEYARRAGEMPSGKWRERFLFALTTSLEVLKPHTMALRALTPVLVGDPEEGIFAASTAFSRSR